MEFDIISQTSLPVVLSLPKIRSRTCAGYDWQRKRSEAGDASYRYSYCQDSFTENKRSILAGYITLRSRARLRTLSGNDSACVGPLKQGKHDEWENIGWLHGSYECCGRRGGLGRRIHASIYSEIQILYSVYCGCRRDALGEISS